MIHTTPAPFAGGACGLSELADCVACACCVGLPKARRVETNRKAASNERTRLFTLRFIVLHLTEMFAC